MITIKAKSKGEAIKNTCGAYTVYEKAGKGMYHCFETYAEFRTFALLAHKARTSRKKYTSPAIYSIIMGLVLCIIIPACGSDAVAADCHLPYGIVADLGGTDATCDELAREIQYFAKHLQEYEPRFTPKHIKQSIHGAQLFLHVDPIDCMYMVDGEWVGGKCWGVAWGEKFVELYYNGECTGVLIHELTHFLVDDITHLDRELWDNIQTFTDDYCAGAK